MGALLAQQLRAQTQAAEAAYRWACTRDTCDGKPHNDAPHKHARTTQRPPAGDWFIWLLLCGRGWGKTRTGSECFLDMVVAHPVDVDGTPTEWLIAGPNYDDTVKLLFEGVSSLSHALRRRNIPYRYNKNEKLITLATGQRIVMSHAEDEDLGRGGNWAGVWLDELGMYKRIKAAWHESLLPSVRAMIPGWTPRIMITTTPKVARKDAWDVLQELTKTPAADIIVTHGTTFENEENIPPPILARWRTLYPVGTRRYRQEMLAELTDDVEGALWASDTLELCRYRQTPDLWRVCVAIDPAGTTGPYSDETGIVSAGLARDGRAYVLDDKSGKYGPASWARIAISLYVQRNADAIVIEATAGAGKDSLIHTLTVEAQAMVSEGLLDRAPNVVAVNATRGKETRAEPIAAYYLHQQVLHPADHPLVALEEQMTTWVPGTGHSPDRVDALVWALTWLATPPAVKASGMTVRR